MIERILASLCLPLRRRSRRKRLHNDNRPGDNGFNGRKYTSANTHACAQRVHTRFSVEAPGSEVLPVLLIDPRPSEIIYQIGNNPGIPVVF